MQHFVLPWRSLNSKFSLNLKKQKETSKSILKAKVFVSIHIFKATLQVNCLIPL